MATGAKKLPGEATIAEMREFAAFPVQAQRYIRRSLDIGLGRGDAVARWARDPLEAASIRAQITHYAALETIRAATPDDSGLDALPKFMGPLVTLSAFDLGQDRLPGFTAYRFLYERLLGPHVRPWLPSAFCGAAALPHLHPKRRRMLLQSITEAAATASGWSLREAGFVPDWVDKVEPVTQPG